MQIDDQIRKCVAFLGYEEYDEKDKVLKKHVFGTGFTIGVSIDGTAGAPLAFFLVTAGHVIKSIQSKGSGKVYVRFNMKAGGAEWVEIASGNWFMHDDSAVDLAIAPLPPLPSHPGHDLLVFPLSIAATADIIRQQDIGIGDEVFLAGLFFEHPGEVRNIPIIRTGAIAAMPEEKVRTKRGEMHAYLIESRSIGGLSGSPVFAYVGRTRSTPTAALSVHGGPPFYLLGIVSSHWDWKLSESPTQQEYAEEKLNMGIAVVVPVERILEVLEKPMIRAMLADVARRLAEKKNLPVDD
jgi:hypothetical protein